MTRYAVIELGKILGVWLAVALLLTAHAGVLLWLSWFAAAHGLAWVYRRRGYRATVVRDGIEIRVRRIPRRAETVTVVARNPYSADGRWKSEQRGIRHIERPMEDAGGHRRDGDPCTDPHH